MKLKQKFRIAHLSDIHVKDARREEYQTVFRRLYESLRTKDLDVIAVCGDIFHDKTKASAHNFSDVENFLVSLVEIAPVVLIPGNHDLNVKTPGAPDLISPVVNNHTILKEPNFAYWRHSGVYYFQELVWVVIAPDGLQPSEQEVNAFVTKHGYQTVPRICLVHETINNAALFNGTSLESKRLNASDLTSYDAVLAGDIHLRQPIGSNGRAMYVGSLVQQNIGEDYEKHGFLIWELETSQQNSPYRTRLPAIHEFDVENEKGYLKIKIENGIELTTGVPSPRHPNYYELFYDNNTTEDQLNFYIEKFTKLYGIAPRAVRQTKSYQKDKNISFASLAEAHDDAQSLEVHEQVIKNIVGENNQYLEEVIKLHRANYSKIITHQNGKSRVRLLDLEFSNVYCYGQDNSIDFTKLENKISGVIAPNQSGKSALVDVIVFALYDEYPRADKKVSIINEKYDTYTLQLRFEVDGKQGIIKKSGRKTRNTSSTECSFFFNNENLTQGTATLTCKEIEKIVGNYDDAQITAISHQGSQSDFVNLRPSERKKSLSQLLSLGYFETLEKTTKEDYNEANFELKLLEKVFQGQSCEEIKQELTTTNKLLQEQTKKLATVDELITHNELEFRSSLGEIQTNKFQTAEIDNKLAVLEIGEDFNLEECTRNLQALFLMSSEQDFLSEKDPLLSTASNDHANSFDLSKVAVLTRKQLQELKARVEQLEVEKQQSERTLLLELKEMELKISNLQFLLEERIKKLSSEYPELTINLEQMKIVSPPFTRQTIKKLPWPTSRKGERVTSQQAIMEASAELINFKDCQESAWQLITEKLATYQLKKLSNEQQLVADYQLVTASLASDIETVATKERFLQELESAKADLKIFENEQKFQNSNSSSKSENVEQRTPRSANLQILRNHLESSKTELLIARNSEVIAEKLSFAEQCDYCNANKKSLVQNNLQQTELNWKNLSSEFTTLLTSKITGHKVRIQEILKILEKIELCQQRIDYLPMLEEKMQMITDYNNQQLQKVSWERKKKALEVMEIVSYWWSKDNKYWQQYDACTENMKSIENLSNEISLLTKNKEILNKQLIVTNKHSSEATESLLKNTAVRNFWLQQTYAAWQKLETAKKRVAEIAQCQELRKDKTELERSLIRFEELLTNQGQRRQELLQERDYAIMQKTLFENKLSLLSNALIAEESRSRKLTAIQKKTAVLAAYRKILDPKVGIADYLLRKSCYFLENEVNSILTDCSASFKIVINGDFELETVSIANRETKTVSAKLSSGYQKFVLGLAFRSSLWRLAETTLLDCRFIDEGFGACDEDNLELLIQYIGMSSASHLYPRINFIVSHVEMMKNAIQAPLSIEVLAGGSRIRNLP